MSRLTNPRFTVLVNTSDGFGDCWAPFFTLYERYWPEADAPLLLNTEQKSWQHPRLPLRSARVQHPGEARLPWSECLRRALAQIDTPLVLYFQEDYFLHRRVDHERVQRAVRYMLDHPEVGHIALTGFGSVGPHLPHAEPWLQTIRPDARYRISTQAGLWRTDVLSSYLLPEENGWMFEICGTWRAQRREDTFLVVRHDEASGGAPIDYLHTGIIKGQWLPEIAEVFRTNGIELDFSHRGFYVPKHPVLRKIETARRLLQHPRHMLRQALG